MGKFITVKSNGPYLRLSKSSHNLVAVMKFEFCAHSARLLRKLDHVLLWILSTNTRLRQCSIYAAVTDLANSCVTQLFRCPQGFQGCLEKRNYPLSSNLVVWCPKIGPKTKKVRKTSELTKKCQKWWFFNSFLKFLGFGPNFSTPNYQIRTQWMISLL